MGISMGLKEFSMSGYWKRRSHKVVQNGQVSGSVKISNNPFLNDSCGGLDNAMFCLLFKYVIMFH